MFLNFFPSSLLFPSPCLSFPPILYFLLHVFIVNGTVLNTISTSMCCILSIFPLLLSLSLSPCFSKIGLYVGQGSL